MYRLDPADRADESVADEVAGSFRAAFVRPTPRAPQLLEPNGAHELTKSGGLAHWSGQVPPDDVVHHIRAAIEVMDDPRSPIGVAEEDARVEYELIRWQIVDGRQGTGAPARISQRLDHELWGLRPDAAPLEISIPARDCPGRVTLRQTDHAAHNIRELVGAQIF